MQRQFAELQNPPPEFLYLIEDYHNKENLLQHTMYLNNAFAFASIHVGTALENDRSLLGVRADICKVNGDFRFCFSDLKPPPNAQKPLIFTNVYNSTGNCSST